MNIWGLSTVVEKYTKNKSEGRGRVGDGDGEVVPSVTETFAFDTTQMPSTTSGAQDITKEVGNSAVKIVEKLVGHAYHAKVSDIHIDPRESQVLVRMRFDGVLRDVYTVPSALHSEIISRIKVMAGLRTDELRAETSFG